MFRNDLYYFIDPEKSRCRRHLAYLLFAVGWNTLVILPWVLQGSFVNTHLYRTALFLPKLNKKNPSVSVDGLYRFSWLPRITAIRSGCYQQLLEEKGKMQPLSCTPPVPPAAWSCAPVPRQSASAGGRLEQPDRALLELWVSSIWG